MLLAGGDLIESLGHPGVWAEDDVSPGLVESLAVLKLIGRAQLHAILGHFGCLIIERTGPAVGGFLLSHDILHYYR